MNDPIAPQLSFKREKLTVQVYANRRAMGESAAADVGRAMKQLLQEKERIRMIFAAAPSQNEFLFALRTMQDLDWSRVTVFHMDEYVGLSNDAAQRFSHFLNERLFSVVQPGEVHLIDGNADQVEECARYAALLNEAPIEIVCLGIGENGHIAFNDPPVANFADPLWVKVVELDEACRQQQVNDGCFPSFSAVPTHALTLTIPALMSGARLFCMVPGSSKRRAVRQTLEEPITTDCPATILRKHPDCTLYVDAASYGGEN